ncbi:MAG: hypothetical protein ACL93V_13430 [Candidatus Electrothrix sp. YB6]
MANRNETASFSLTLFNIYKKEKDADPPTFTWTEKKGSHQAPFLEPDQKGSKAVQSALHRLYPLAGKIFKKDQVFRTMPQVLLNELNDTKNGTWQVGSDQLPVCLPRAGGFCLEEKYLLLYLEVQPIMPEINADCPGLFNSRKSRRNQTDDLYPYSS